jgi:hypothetical protein
MPLPDEQAARVKSAMRKIERNRRELLSCPITSGVSSEIYCERESKVTIDEC